jgi:uncharacterized protein (DUF1501 family)
MATSRRQFIKRGLGAVTVSVMVPKMGLLKALGQETAARLDRRLVVIQFGGGNDGLNTIIPYSDSRYLSLRPTLSFKDTELVDSAGVSTMINSELGFHPVMKEIRDLYQQNKVAIMLGVGEPNQSTSHFTGTTNIASGRTDGRIPAGWLGTYAKQAFGGSANFMAAAIGGSLPQMFYSDYVIPNISSFAQYTFQTDNRFTPDRKNQVAAFNAATGRSFPGDNLMTAIAGTGKRAFDDSVTIQTETAKYNPTGYPNTGLGNALKMVSQLLVTIPSTSLTHLQLGGFDTHQGQIQNGSKLVNGHAGLLTQFSQAIKAFHDDIAAQPNNLAQNTIIMTYSEFGRRPQENGTSGSDHGSLSCWFVIGDSVRGGLYGRQPSLLALDLDGGGNPKFGVNSIDLRSIYATILSKWFNHDPRAVLDGGPFAELPFL